MRASLSTLPEDLLAHVLRFATGSARRDGAHPQAVPLSDFRYATVSTTFRKAFLKNLTSLAVTNPAARHLAAVDWQPLRACTSLRYIVIGSESGLYDHQVVRLFRVLHAAGIRIRQADITVDRGITQASVLCFANLFGSSVTHLDVRVPWVRRVRRRRLHNPNFPIHPALPGAQPPPVTPAQLLQQDQPLPQPPNLEAANPEHLANLQNLPLALLGPNLLPDQPLHQLPALLPPPVINVFDGVQVPNQAANFEELANMIGAEPENDADFVALLENDAAQQNMPVNLHQHLPPQIPQNFPPHLEIPPLQIQLDDIWQNPPQPVNHDENDAGEALLQMANEAHANENNLDQPVEPVPAFLNAIANITNSLYSSLSNDVFATVVSRLTGLQELVIDRARHITNSGILALANCTKLETLVLYGNHSINDVAMNSVLRTMEKLRVLRLRDMVLIGDGTINGVCSGSGSRKLEFLELTRIGRVTDPAIKRLVNSCENLKTVHIFDCPQISCDAASHLSCSLRLADVVFKPQARFPLMNRTPVHLSCASSTLRSLQLVGCLNLSLDGIVALGNLPGLRKLHLNGLGQVSQDVMRALGVFPKLDDLTLHGAMNLTDLGVKVLTAQRGHRFLHLSLLDATMNLTDEALECVMTWCVSLRTLEIHGMFRAGAIDRLHEYNPQAAIKVATPAGYASIEGLGGVWDPIRQEALM